MKILVIGSGGREHALCWAFCKSQRVEKLYCANGNAGIGQIAECVPIRPEEIKKLADFATQNSVDITFVGGETALSLGVVDEFESRGLRIIGPIQQAAKLESSKSFAKDFMARHGVPTAKYATANSPVAAVEILNHGDFGDESTPVVVKADGLAAGKGVVVAKNRSEAVAAINEMAVLVGPDAAEKIVIEECLVGREVSLLMFADGEDFVLLPAVRDHKRIGDGDTGPNTGGMGTITDGGLLSGAQIEEIIEHVIEPTLSGCVTEGFAFRGILFLGLMMTDQGAKVIEYNVRFGDPETQAIVVRLETDLVDICEAMLDRKLSTLDIKWRQGSSACVVLASEGYPSKPRIGDVITGLDKVTGVEIFHAGTAVFENKESTAQNAESNTTNSKFDIHNSTIVTAGGRVLGVTAVGDDLGCALKAVYSAVEHIKWPGMQYRKDIGR